MWGMVQQRLCLTCNTPFEVPPSSKRRYCSTACQPRQSHSTRARPAVRVTCGHCGQEFERKAWVAEQQERLGRAQYCSVECRDEAKRGRRGERRVARITKTCPNCGEEFGSDREPNQIRRQKYCSRSCAARAAGGRPRPGPEGTSFVNRDGYVIVYVPPEERPDGRKGTPYQLEHRLVMSKVLGRWPTRRETVHHVNGDKTDNRPENLQLRSGSHGRGHVLRCRECGSSDIEALELS